MGLSANLSHCENCKLPDRDGCGPLPVAGVCCVTGGKGCDEDIAVIGGRMYRVGVLWPVANAGSNQTIIAGQSVSLGQAPAAGYVYRWTPATGLSSTIVANPTAFPAVTTTYTFTVAASPEFTASGQVTISVASAPGLA